MLIINLSQNILHISMNFIIKSGGLYSKQKKVSGITVKYIYNFNALFTLLFDNRRHSFLRDK